MRFITVLSALVFLAVFSSTVVAQETVEWSLPLTADGQPDLQGVWDFRTLTPLQRPDDRGDQATLTEEEAAQIEQRSAMSSWDDFIVGSMDKQNVFTFCIHNVFLSTKTLSTKITHITIK